MREIPFRLNFIINLSILSKDSLFSRMLINENLLLCKSLINSNCLTGAFIPLMFQKRNSIYWLLSYFLLFSKGVAFPSNLAFFEFLFFPFSWLTMDILGWDCICNNIRTVYTWLGNLIFYCIVLRCFNHVCLKVLLLIGFSCFCIFCCLIWYWIEKLGKFGWLFHFMPNDFQRCQ